MIVSSENTQPASTPAPHPCLKKVRQRSTFPTRSRRPTGSNVLKVARKRHTQHSGWLGSGVHTFRMHNSSRKTADRALSESMESFFPTAVKFARMANNCNFSLFKAAQNERFFLPDPFPTYRPQHSPDRGTFYTPRITIAFVSQSYHNKKHKQHDILQFFPVHL